jgi:hypothetical protein
MPINVQLLDANFSFGPESGFFYTCNFTNQELRQVEADGTVVDSFPVARSTFRNPIKELHFDGTFFWTLEDLPSNLGIVIKRWRISPFPTAIFPGVTPIEFRWQDELTLINGPNMRWSADAFAIEHYHLKFSGSFLQGVSTIRVDDASKISPGEKLYLGPSGFGTLGAFVGNQEEITVLSVNSITGDVTFSKGGGLENSFLSDDPITLHKSIYLFNDNSFGGQDDGDGNLVNFDYPSRQQLFTDNGAKYASVTAADFSEDILSWVRSFQILEINFSTPSLDLSVSQESNLVEDDLTTQIEVFDMISDFVNDQYLKLQDRETTESLATGVLSTTIFPSPRKYNFQVQPTGAFVNSVSMEFVPNRFVKPLPSADKIFITTRVRDQFNFPVLSATIDWSADLNSESDAGSVGTFNPASAETNASGIAETIYTPSSTPNDIIVDIIADVA